MKDYTPGPWWYQEDIIQKLESKNNRKTLDMSVSKFKHLSVQGKDGTFVSYCGTHERTETNARLIAAVPDLLAACEDGLVGISEASVKIDRKHLKVAQTLLIGTFQIIEAAIAKAKGNENG